MISLDGIFGIDTAVYDGYSSGYLIYDTFEIGLAGVNDLRTGSPDGNDILREIEFYQFHGVRLTAFEAFHNHAAVLGYTDAIGRH